MKLKALMGEREISLAIEEGDGRVRALIDGRSYDLEVRNAGNSYLLLNQGKVFECRVEKAAKSRDHFLVTLKHRRHSMTILDPRRLRADENSDRHHHGPTEIAAQIPGKVVRVLVQAGTPVEKGAGVVIVEAMKMQNEMKSPRSGLVVSVNVAAGDTVNSGEVLATVGDANDA